jgi:hypothetical protein
MDETSFPNKDQPMTSETISICPHNKIYEPRFLASQLTSYLQYMAQQGQGGKNHNSKGENISKFLEYNIERGVALQRSGHGRGYVVNEAQRKLDTKVKGKSCGLKSLDLGG